MRIVQASLLFGLLAGVTVAPASAQSVGAGASQPPVCDDGGTACNPAAGTVVVDKAIKPPAALPMVGKGPGDALATDDTVDPRFIAIDMRQAGPQADDSDMTGDDEESASGTGPSVPTRRFTRSTGGRRALAGEARWQAQIYQPWSMRRFAAAGMADGRPLWQLQHICGGVLIGEGWLLTAAHCVDNPDGQRRPGYRVRLGAIDFSREDGWTYLIDRVERFPLYRDPAPGAPPRTRYDIALVHFSRDAETADGEPPDTLVRPIALDDRPPPAEGEPVQATGWGVMAGQTPTPVMMLVKMDVVAEDRCARLWGTPRNPTVVCAGRENVQTCQGDSGGPLVNIRGAPRLIGIVSYNLRACVGDAERPGVYTRVATADYLEWVTKITGLPRRAAAR